MTRREFDWDSYMNELMTQKNPRRLFNSLERGFSSYPIENTIPVTVNPNSPIDPEITVYVSNRTNGQRKEFLTVLKHKLKKYSDIEYTSNIDKDLGYIGNNENEGLILDWIKDKEQILKESNTNKTQNLFEETEVNIENIDAQNAMQTVYLLIQTGFLQYLTETKRLTETQAFKLMGTLTGINWDLIRRYYNGYNTGKNQPNVKNNNNPDNENTRIWFANLSNEYKIKLK